MLRDMGRAAEAAAAFARAAQIGEEIGDLSQECISRQSICVALALGPMPVEQALRRCEAEIAIVSRRDWARPFMGSWAAGMLQAQLGEQEQGLTMFDAAEAICRKSEVWDGLALTSFFRSWLYELVDDWASAESELRSCFEQFAAAADRGMRQLVAGRLARVLVRVGNLDEAEDLARSASREGDADDFSEQVAWRQGLALVEAARGRYVQARKVAREAVDLAERSDWLNLHAETLEDLAAVESAAGKIGDASTALDQAIALYERKGNRVAAERTRRTRELSA
jgi:tetratricopeptide (TPR) repeat protein